MTSAAAVASPHLFQSAPALFKPYHVLMAVVFAVALGAAYTMLPDDNEIIAMLERDGHSGDAIAILEENYKQGDRRYRMLNQLLELYENEGTTAKARTILEEMVAQRPNDAALRERLARFYRAIGDGGARIDALRAQIALRYKESACREYVSLVRLGGDASAEIGALQMCRQKGYRRPDDLARLGVLLASTGETAQALSLLRAIDDVRRLKAQEDRQLLISLLLQQQQPNEAERRAIRWIKSGGSQALALSIVDELAAERYPDSALEVAKSAGEQGDSISLTVAERLLERAQVQPARLYLKGWLDSARFDTVETFERFVAAALEAEDPATGFDGARKFGIGRVPPAAAASLASALLAAGYFKEASALNAAAGTAAPKSDLTQTGGGQAVESGTSISRETRTRGATDPAEALAGWRRTLVMRMSDDAQRRMPSAGNASPRHSSAGEGRGHHMTRVLKKTSKVLQRSKQLKSLKIKRRLTKEKAAKHGAPGKPND